MSTYHDGTERIHWGDCVECEAPIMHEGDWDEAKLHGERCSECACPRCEHGVVPWPGRPTGNQRVHMEVCSRCLGTQEKVAWR